MSKKLILLKLDFMKVLSQIRHLYFFRSKQGQMTLAISMARCFRAEDKASRDSLEWLGIAWDRLGLLGIARCS